MRLHRARIRTREEIAPEFQQEFCCQHTREFFDRNAAGKVIVIDLDHQEENERKCNHCEFPPTSHLEVRVLQIGNLVPPTFQKVAFYQLDIDEAPFTGEL